MTSRALWTAVLATCLAGGSARAQYVFTSAPQPYAALDGGVAVTLTGTPTYPVEDEGAAVIPLGFTFPYYGNSYTNVLVNSNGVLVFGPEQSKCNYSLGGVLCLSADPGLPSTSSGGGAPGGRPHNVIAPWWEDLEGN